MVAWNYGDFRVVSSLVALCALLSGCVDKRERVGTTSASGSASSSVRAAKIDDVKNACTSICERSQVLRCLHADECLVNCVAAGSGTPCNAEFQAFYQCLVPQPIKNWECDEDGVASIKPGNCDKEQERAIQCMAAKAQP
jgi:hypothetical protein